MDRNPELSSSRSHSPANEIADFEPAEFKKITTLGCVGQRLGQFFQYKGSLQASYEQADSVGQTALLGFKRAFGWNTTGFEFQGRFGKDFSITGGRVHSFVSLVLSPLNFLVNTALKVVKVFYHLGQGIFSGNRKTFVYKLAQAGGDLLSIPLEPIRFVVAVIQKFLGVIHPEMAHHLPKFIAYPLNMGTTAMQEQRRQIHAKQ